MFWLRSKAAFRLLLIVECLSFQPLFEERVIERDFLPVHVNEILLQQGLFNGLHIGRRLQAIFLDDIFSAESSGDAISKCGS